MDNVKITVTDSRSLGRCYSSTTYLVESPRKLTNGDWGVLRAARRLGYGQEFYVNELGEEGGIHRYKVEDRVDSSD
ncbi:hypothetical protein EBZ70_12895 [bacterium]|nr:hypothetical protein [bacterium]